MTAPLPSCAWCGTRLTGARVLHSWHARGLGVPEVGWHERCFEADPLYPRRALTDGTPVPDLELLLTAVAARGPGRVVRRGRRVG